MSAGVRDEFRSVPWKVFTIASPAGVSYRIYAEGLTRTVDIAHIPREWADPKIAALIAAAPELLDALRAVKHGAEYPDELGDVIDAAIFKAETAAQTASGAKTT